MQQKIKSQYDLPEECSTHTTGDQKALQLPTLVNKMVKING